MSNFTTEPRELTSTDASSPSSAGPVFAPRDAGEARPHVRTAAVSGIELRVSRDAAPTRRLRINARRCTFGSGEGCTVRLSDASLRPLHAAILHETGRVLIRGCPLAIEVNGRSVIESSLDVGDVFRLGEYRFEILALPSEPLDRTTDQAVGELHAMIASLNAQVETLTADAAAQRATASAELAELRASLAASQQAEAASGKAAAAPQTALNDALQQRDKALQQRDKALARRTEAIDIEQAAQAKLRQANQKMQQLQEELDQSQQWAERQRAQRREQPSRSSEVDPARPSLLADPPAAPTDPPAAEVADELFERGDETSKNIGESDDEPSIEAQMSRLLHRVGHVRTDDGGAAEAAQRHLAQPHDRPAVSCRRTEDPRSGETASNHRGQTTNQRGQTQQLKGHALLNLLQPAVVLICSAVFFYCGQRNPALQGVWYTASILAGGLAMFFLYDLRGRHFMRLPE